MKRHARKTAIGLLALAAILAAAVPVLAIVNGTLDTENDFPNVGAVVVTRTPTTFPGVPVPQTISSGTLVSPRVLLTAGHTVAFMEELMESGGLKLDDFAVSFRLDAHDESQRYIGVAGFMTHEEFIAFAGNREAAVGLDVGVVLLDRRVNIKPVKLARAGLLDEAELIRRETPFTVVGYGAVLPEEEFPPPVIAVLPLPDGRRRWAISTFGVLHENYLFLSQKLAQGEGGVSNGDSGGPAYAVNGDGELVQVGIVSSSDDVNTSLGVFTRTDLPEVLDFVDEVIAGFEH